ncbi:hypothetical protein BXT86_05895 [candidate division WOR-3 bacterium 4484_100]|uniref:Uncharacterized protein n=1 Tax=candidate division WOR-3 bacterium 4484_100 TaxID=1936077 RepID=A0A1V4QFP5_UNCW3|nr:MAG: hypothetical protein BXT86_05895 [candidate division WOR-3 bacterium 4484_100]
MKRLLILLVILGTGLYASQRVVVSETFTATWCPYCPGAARGVEENYDRSYDSLVVIGYHPSTSDPFYSSEAAARSSYYGISGYPTIWFDGTISEVGGEHSGTMYPLYRRHLTTRLGVSSPLEINLTCTYDSTSNSGTVQANIQNTSGSSVSGYLFFVIVENDIPYNWQGMTKLDFAMRDMLPSASGESVTIPASDTIIRSTNFTINSAWDEHNCKIVVFVQASNKEIYQGAEIGLFDAQEMTYYDVNLAETSGNGNGFAEPGESMAISAFGKNIRDGVYTGTASVSCSDPYITITSSTPQSVSLGPGDVGNVIDFAFDISAGCPDPHQVQFDLDFGNGDVSSIPFIITTQPGFSDDIESGQGDWTHSGTNDNWHITTHKSNSPTHSWYCGVEGSWQYTNENDAKLVSPYFVVTPDSSLYFYQQYSLETNYDYGYIEVDNGSGWFQILDDVNGTQASWVQASYSLTNYAGKTIRLRFRFISDPGTIQEGWYVDDILVPGYIGIKENKSEASTALRLQVVPNPFVRRTTLVFQAGAEKVLGVDIYDSSGRCIRQFQNITEQVIWDGTDKQGTSVPAGVYFVKLRTGSKQLMEKVVLVR